MIKINKTIKLLIQLIEKCHNLDAVDKARIIEKIKWILIEIKYYAK